MKTIKIYLILLITFLLLSCSKQIFLTNGETIYKTGKNISGEKLLDKSNSRIKIVNRCKTCHGKNGDKMNDVSIKFSYLSDSNNFSTPYNDSLFKKRWNKS
jgi:cytochrome c553